MEKNGFLIYVENEIGRKIKFFGILEKKYGKIGNLRSNIHKEEVENEIYIKNKKYPERGITYNGECYYLNPNLVEEIYLWYKFKNEYQFGRDHHKWDIEQIKFKTTTIINQSELKNVLEKKLKKYRKKLNNNLIAELYFSHDETLNIESNLFEEFIRLAIFTDEDLIDEYLTSSSKSEEEIYEEFSNDNNIFLKSWSSLISTKKTIDFIIEELKRLDTETETNKEYKDKKIKFNLTLPQKVLLIDRIRCINDDDWDSLENTKKAKLMSLITGNSKQTIRKIIPKINQKVKEDIQLVDSLIKKELG